MARYEIICVDVDQNSEYDDCRCIERIGFPAESEGIATRTPAEVYDMIEEDGHTIFVEHEGSETEVIADTHGDTKYVRSSPNDTEDDNLLEQPSC